MRLFILLTLLLAITSKNYGQPYALDDFFRQHRLSDDMFKINIGPVFIRIGSWFTREPALKHLMQKSRRARILYTESPHKIDQFTVRGLINEIEKDGYENLIQISDMGEKVNLYAKEMKGQIRNLLVIVRATDEFVLADLDCRLTVEEIYGFLKEQDRYDDAKLKPTSSMQ